MYEHECEYVLVSVWVCVYERMTVYECEYV